MNILLFNQDWFAPELRKAGHRVVSCGLAEHLEVRLDIPMLHLSEIERRWPKDFRPDLVVFFDNSQPLLIGGIDTLAVPTLFYSVDTHHHAHLHKHLSLVFDATCVAQKDFIADFNAAGSSPHWLPLWAPRFVEPSTEKKFDAVFVGNIDRALNPERVTFFEELAKLVPVHFERGEYWKIVPFSEVSINQTVKGDLNFRVFETMMCGATLLTENSSNGLFELFKKDVHILTYERNNAAQAAEEIRRALSDRGLARTIAKAGRDEILARHTQELRGQQFINIIQGLKKRDAAQRKFSLMFNYSVASQHLFGIDADLAGTAAAATIEMANKGVQAGEALTPELAYHAIFSAKRFDKIQRSTEGAKLIETLRSRYQEAELLLAHPQYFEAV